MEVQLRQLNDAVQEIISEQMYQKVSKPWIQILGSVEGDKSLTHPW